MDVLLHVPLEHIIDQESKGDVAHARKMKYFDGIDNLGWRHKNVHRGKVLTQTMSDEDTTTGDIENNREKVGESERPVSKKK